MSADPSELLRFILVQQQQQQQQGQQRQGDDAQSSTTRQLQQLYQHLAALAPARNDATQQQQQQPRLDALSRLVANHLQGAAGGGANAAAPASGVMPSLPQALAALAAGRSHSVASRINNDTPSVSDSASMLAQQQELLKAAKLLAAINPGLATAAVEQALAIGAQSVPKVQQQQQICYAQASCETNAAADMSSIKVPVNTKGNTDAPIDVMLIDSCHKSIDSITDSRKSESDHSATKSDQRQPLMSIRTQPPAQLLRGTSQVATSSTGSLNRSLGADRKLRSTESSRNVDLPAEPVSFATLQTWNIEQLESHVKKLEASNQPIPNTVRIVLEDAREKEEKKHAKKLANRKSASTSRARQKQRIDELTAAHAKLRRQALILANLPDPVVVIGASGVVKFCSIQIEGLLKYKLNELLGSNIEDFIVPDSRGALRQLIQDWIENKHRDFLAREDERNQHEANNAANQDNDENNSNSSQDASNEANNVSLSSGQSFPLLEVDFDGEDRVDTGKSLSNSSSATSKKNKTTSKLMSQARTFSSFTHHSSSLTAETSTSEDKDEPPAKKVKTCDAIENAMSEKSSSNELNLRKTQAVNIDDVMGSSVTRNNADAKLSSLMHYPKNNAKEEYDTTTLTPAVPIQKPCLDDKHEKYANMLLELSGKHGGSASSSVDSSTPTGGAGLNSSEDSGYRDSNVSSDDCEQDDSLISGSSESFKKKGKRLRPLAPACNVCFIRNDLTHIWCELTSSIHTRAPNCDNGELCFSYQKAGIQIDVGGQAPNEDEKEILLCFRPILECGKVGKELHTPGQNGRLSNQDKD